METDILEETATAVKQEDESKNIVSVDDKARIAIDDEENGEVDISYNLETSNKESKEIYDHFQHDEFYEYDMIGEDIRLSETDEPILSYKKSEDLDDDVPQKVFQLMKNF